MLAKENARTDAHRDRLGRLVDDGVLSFEQGEAVRAALTGAPARRDGPARWLVEVAGYVGGGLMLAGVTLFLAASWNELTQTARSALFAAFALVFVGAGMLAAGGPLRVRGLATGETSARRRIVGVLFGLAAVPAALAMGTGVDSYEGLSGGLVGLAVGAAGLVLLPTVAGMVVTAAMSLFVVLSFGGEVLDASPLGTGLLLFALGVAWTGVAVLHVVPSRQLGLAVGAGLALTGAQQLVVTDGAALWGYGLTFAVAVGCFLLYRWQRLVVLLVAGVLGMTLVVPEAVNDWTNGAMGGAVVLLVAGAVLVATSSLGLRIRRTAQAN
jgi:hypothetical protein